MKKILPVILCGLFILSYKISLAAENPLFDTRTKVFELSKEIKKQLASTKDIILVSSMWDSCAMAISQVDAYIYMAAIVNTIQNQNLTKEAVSYLGNWLAQAKQTNNINLKSLEAVSSTIDPKTQVYLGKLKELFAVFGGQLDAELRKISALEKSLSKKISGKK